MSKETLNKKTGFWMEAVLSFEACFHDFLSFFKAEFTMLLFSISSYKTLYVPKIEQLK